MDEKWGGGRVGSEGGGGEEGYEIKLFEITERKKKEKKKEEKKEEEELHSNN